MLTKTHRFLSVQIALVLLVTAFISMPVHAKVVMAGNEVQAADGDLDASFGTGGIVTTDFNSPYDFGSSVVLQPDGKIVVGGETTISSGNFDFALARYMPDGSFDATFGSNGRVTTDFDGQSDEGNAVALQADGKILLAGYTWNQASNQSEFALARFNSNGSLDITFDMDGKVITSIGDGVYGYDVAVQPDGKIVIVGEVLINNGRDFVLVRYNSNGSLDTGFGVNGITMTDLGNSDGGYAVLVQPSDWKMIVGGYSVTADNTYIALARYNSNGSLDTTFDNDGKVITSVGKYDHILDLALQADGKILAAGTGENINGSLDFMLVRYDSNGSLDTTFDSDGKVMTDFGSDEVGSAVAVQPDGRILMAGAGNSRTTLALARYLSNGSLDPGFGINGKVTTSVPDKIVGYDLALQPDHNIIVVGGCCNSSNVDFMVARYIYHAAPATTLMVTKTADTNDGICDLDCSLREAIVSSYDGDVIRFNSSLAGKTIILLSYLDTITRDLTIDGSALASRVKISGNNSVSVFAVDQASVTFKNLIITNGGTVNDWGGGIANYNGTVDIIDCVLTGNSASEGGGIYNTGTLNIINSTISSNRSDYGGGIRNAGTLNMSKSVLSNNSSGFGGGILNDAGDDNSTHTINITESTFSNNSAAYSGGGISSNNGMIRIANSSFSGNTATETGGGIYTNLWGELKITNSTFSNNSAGMYGGGAVITATDLLVENSTFTNNSGSAIRSAAGTVELSGSTFSGNTGPAVLSGNGILRITNSTFTANVANQASGIESYADDMILVNNTFSNNQGGAVYTNTGKAVIQNNIIANSTLGLDCYNDGSSITSANNLIENNGLVDQACGIPATSADPQLGPLQDNGGFTQTMALQAGSPAIDAGSNAGCPGTDQRGVSRPQGSHCDIGAFEYEFLPTPTELIIASDSPDPSEIEGWVTVSVVVSNIGDGAAQPTGVVHITGADANCDMTLNHGTGSCDVRFDTAGDKVISAFYEGDDSHMASSNDQPHSVQIWPTTLFILSDLPDPSITNKSFTVAVQVTGGRISPTGTVTVAGDGVSCTITLSMGTGSCLLSFGTIGQKTLTATYNGDSLHLPSTDTELHQVVQGIPTVGTFADVPMTHPYYSDIEILYANGLTGGCATNPLKFCPDQIMNRGQAAVFMLRANFGSGYVPPVPTHIFKDDWTKGPWAEGWAEGMKAEALSAGCLANPLKYCPWDQIPREQAVIFALRMKYGTLYTPPPATGTVFADMTNPGYYATSWAEQAYKDGIIQSCGTSGVKPKFCPKNMVSRGLAAYMIVRARDLSMP